MNAISYVQQLISVNQTAKALEVLRKLTQPLEDEIHQEVLVHSGNFARLLEDRSKGLLSKEEEKIQFTRLHAALLVIAGQLPVKTAIEVPSQEWVGLSIKAFAIRSRRNLLLVWATLMTALLAFLVYQSHIGISIQANIKADRLTFRTIGNNTFKFGQPLSSLQIGQFDEASIPAQQITLAEDPDTPPKPYFVTNGQLEVDAAKDGESSLLINKAWLQQLECTQPTQFVFTIPDEETTPPAIVVDAQPGKLTGNIIFQDSLTFEGNNVLLKGLSGAPAHPVMWGLAKVATTGQDALEMTFKGSEAPLLLLIEPQINTQALQQQRIQIDSAGFIRSEGQGTFKSSIKAAEIQLVTAKNNTYQKINLAGHDFLRLLGYKRLEVVSLSLSGNAIEIQLSGKIDRLYTGPTPDQLRLRNPSRLSWLWFNQPFLLLLLALLALAPLAVLRQPRL